MKRKFLFLLSCMSALTLTGCFDSESDFLLPEIPEDTGPSDTLPDLDNPELDDDLSDEELVYAIVDYLESSLPKTTNKNFSVLTNYEDVSLVWSVSDEEVAAVNDGIVSIVRDLEDATFTLEALITLNDYSYTGNFEVGVEKLATANEIISITSQNLGNEYNYLKSTSGTSFANSTVNVTQNISNNVYVFEDYVYAHLYSESWAVKFVHQAVFKNDYVSYNHNTKGSSSSTPSKTVEENEYLNVYGIDYTDMNFAGYLMNDETILSTKYVGYENNLHMFEYDLDLSKSNEAMKIQMKEVGGLKTLPDFTEIKITIYVDNDYNLYKYDSLEYYSTIKTVGWDQHAKMEQKLSTSIIRYTDETLPDLNESIGNYITAIS